MVKIFNFSFISYANLKWKLFFISTQILNEKGIFQIFCNDIYLRKNSKIGSVGYGQVALMKTKKHTLIHEAYI